MQTQYNPYMTMQYCMNCPYMMQGQCPYMGVQEMDNSFVAPEQYQAPEPPEMKREDIDENVEYEKESGEDEYRMTPFGGRPRPRPRPFFPPFFFPPFFFPRPRRFFFPPFFFPFW